MQIRKSLAIILLISVGHIVPAFADANTPAAGDACSTANQVVLEGGTATSGVGYTLFCNGSRWVLRSSITTGGNLALSGSVQPGYDSTSCTTAKAGAISFNSSSGQITYCTGSAWTPFSQCAGPVGKNQSLATGLLHYWSFNEGSGNNLLDNLNNVTDGAWNGSSGWATGKISNAGSFSSTYININDSSMSLNDASISFWFKTTTNNENIITLQNASDILSAQIGDTTAGGNANSLNSYVRTSTNTLLVANGVTNVLDGNWHFGVIVRNTSTQKLNIYVDGNLDSTSALPDTTTLNLPPKFLGYAGSSVMYNGLMDEVGLWGRVLSQAEITTLYNSGAANAFSIKICKSIGGFAT